MITIGDLQKIIIKSRFEDWWYDEKSCDYTYFGLPKTFIRVEGVVEDWRYEEFLKIDGDPLDRFKENLFKVVTYVWGREFSTYYFVKIDDNIYYPHTNPEMFFSFKGIRLRNEYLSKVSKIISKNRRGGSVDPYEQTCLQFEKEVFRDSEKKFMTRIPEQEWKYVKDTVFVLLSDNNDMCEVFETYDDASEYIEKHKIISYNINEKEVRQ